MPSPLADRADALPTLPGVYLFKGRKGAVLYVGKAGNLRSRVRQYLSGHDGRSMVPFLIALAHDVDFVVTRNEKEALLLENSLIKKHQPRFNVKLVDDKNFLHLRIDLKTEWPRYHVVRRIKNDGAKYFGPYASASKARQTLAFLHRAFPLRSCTDQVLRARTRPCLLHQIGRCVAPCVPGVDRLAYERLAGESMMLLEGRKRPVIDALERRMFEAAEREAYEEAAKLRDLVASIRATLEGQAIVDSRLADRDVWGIFRQGHQGAVALLPVREGVVGEPRVQLVDGFVEDDGALLSALLNTTYAEGGFIPPQILVPAAPDDVELLAEALTERRGRKVTIEVPARGQRTELIALATENARVRWIEANDATARRQAALEELARIIGLKAAPRRMECFDNSNLQGEAPVAAMSVFIDGEPARAEYRRYRVKTVVGADDYATMREILERRVRRGMAENNLPDLLVVDGGKGQLGVALAVLDDLGCDVPVIGISKPRTEHKRGERDATDKIVLPNTKDPIRLRPENGALRILQHLRDEVHKHAVRYHRKVRDGAQLTSVLEALPGVGPARRKALLAAFGSVRGVADATVEDIAAVDGIGPALAARIHAAFSG